MTSDFFGYASTATYASYLLQRLNELMEECDHGGDPATCPVCRRAAGKDKPEVTYTDPFEALFTGPCADCHQMIERGDMMMLRLEVNGDRRPIHESCS